MFCSNCGKNIQDGSLFCTYCGAKVIHPVNNKVHNIEAEIENTEIKKANGEDDTQKAVNSETEAADESTEATNSKGIKMLIIGLLSLLFVLILAIIASIFIISKLDSKSVSKVEETEMDEDDDSESEWLEENDEIMQEAADTIVTQEMVEEVSKDTTVAVEEPQEDYTLLVGVPVEYMSLRTAPGLGDDVIAELYPGTYMKWYGETEIVNDTEFYKVTVKNSGQQGYVSSDFCVVVNNESDDSVLSLVETNTTLYTYDMMEQDIYALCNTYSDILTYNIIGKSNDGRNIFEVILGNENAENHIMMQAAIHGREYMNTQLVMKLLEYYAYYYDSGKFGNSSYKEIFDKTAIHIVPMSNPDGVTISQLGVDGLNNQKYKDIVYEAYENDKYNFEYEIDSNGDMLWNDHYKDENFVRNSSQPLITFEEYQKLWKANAAAIDLNNNFDAGWYALDLKSYISHANFPGYYPVSEPESQALEQLAQKHDYSFFVSYHSRGQLIYYDVNGNSATNSVSSDNYATLLENWIKYRKVNTKKAYNVNLGGFGDWVQLSLNKPSVTIESGKSPCPLGIQEFQSMWYRHKESWAMLAQQYSIGYR